MLRTKVEPSQAIVPSLHLRLFWATHLFTKAPKQLLEETIKRSLPPGNLSLALEFLWHFILNKQEGLNPLWASKPPHGGGLRWISLAWFMYVVSGILKSHIVYSLWKTGISGGRTNQQNPQIPKLQTCPDYCDSPGSHQQGAFTSPMSSLKTQVRASTLSYKLKIPCDSQLESGVGCGESTVNCSPVHATSGFLKSQGLNTSFFFIFVNRIIYNSHQGACYLMKIRLWLQL